VIHAGINAGGDAIECQASRIDRKYKKHFQKISLAMNKFYKVIVNNTLL